MQEFIKAKVETKNIERKPCTLGEGSHIFSCTKHQYSSYWVSVSRCLRNLTKQYLEPYANTIHIGIKIVEPVFNKKQMANFLSTNSTK